MQKILFSLALLALCASQTNMPAHADTQAAENPVQQQQNAPQAHGQQPESQHPENQQPEHQQTDKQTGTQPNPASKANTGAETAPANPQNPPAASQADPADATNAPRCLPPLRELVTSPFGNRRMPGWLSRRGMVMRDHAGIDIRARMGWPVTAFKPGTVVRAGDNGALGISVDIRQDDGMTARYGHMSKTLAKSGQRVEAGEPVGLVGCTGRTTGAHLHFGLLDAAGKYVDPLPYLHSADEVLHPAPADIPPVLEAQSCGPVQRGPNGQPVRIGEMLKKMDNYSPPPIPTWNERR